MDSTTDLQCEAIRKGLLELEGVLEKPLTNEALDLEHSVESSERKLLLVRLRKSLVQSVEKQKSCIRRFIGHFFFREVQHYQLVIIAMEYPSTSKHSEPYRSNNHSHNRQNECEFGTSHNGIRLRSDTDGGNRFGPAQMVFVDTPVLEIR